MKKRSKRRRTPSEPQVILVGNSGKINRDSRLCRLRMTKKFKNLLMQQEYEESEKTSEVTKLVEQYKNLLCLILSLKQENANNSNRDLLKELEEIKADYRERLFHIDPLFMKRIPNELQKSVQEILDCYSKPNGQHKSVRNSLLHEQRNSLKRSKKFRGDGNPYCGKARSTSVTVKNVNKSDHGQANERPISKIKKSKPSSGVTRNSWSGCYKSQIFVRKSNAQLQAINIDLFSLGSNLHDMLAEELGEDVTRCNLMFGAKEVVKEKTLFEQEIYHGSTVDVVLPLYGGMGRKKKKHTKASKNSKATLKPDKGDSLEEMTKRENEQVPMKNEIQEAGEVSMVKDEPKEDKLPESCTQQKIQHWFENAAKMLDINITEVSNLKCLNFKVLNILKKEDWLRRSPSFGDALFNMWQKDQDTITKEKDEEARASPTPFDRKKENVEDNLNEPEDSSLNVDRQQEDVLKRSGIVFFGKAEDEMAESFSVEDFENNDVPAKPKFGSVITVTGVCSSTPHMQGNVTTMFIRDDPQGAASYYNELKILIIGCERIKQKIDILSKEIKMDMLLRVKGRVEKMEEEDGNDGGQMLKFKLVIDSAEHHGLFSIESKPPKLRRQLSQSWLPVGADIRNGDELNINVGDFIRDNNDLERVYCDADVSDEQIVQYVVAFKNSFDGEIFVGVEKNAQITGMEVNNGGIKKWRERISMAIGSLLPEANEGADICENIQEASVLVDKRRCFVCVLPLCNDKNKALGWIHVPKGEARVYFIKASDVHAYKRAGAENKRIINYEDLFYSLESLASRQIEPAFEEEYDEEDLEQDGVSKNGIESYRVLDKVAHESQHHELKMIFGDKPVNTIQEKYLGPYACGFLNSDGGKIFFGVEEDEKSKNGHIVGIVLSKQERKDLGDKTVTTLKNFYPPVSKSQFNIKFHPVCIPTELIVKARGGGKFYAKIVGPADEVGKKWPKFIQKEIKVKSRSAVIPLRSQCFCVVASKKTSEGGNFTELVEKFVNDNSKFTLNSINEIELKDILKNLFVVELSVSRSPYPIHMVKTIDTYVLSKDKEKRLCACKLSREDLMDRFKLDSTSEFDVDKFLGHVKNFDNAGNSFILITSPFDLPEKERDLYGLVIPKWTLTIDLDQEPKQPGHLYEIFQRLNDRYQSERDRFLKTPQDSKLDLNPDHAVCWLAARGYREDVKSLSGDSHAKWIKTHKSRVRELLNDDLKTNVKPNRLKVVVLWDEGHKALVESLRTILEDVISLNGDDSTVVTFVCASPKARLIISNKIVEPLQEDNWDTISEERVHVAPPYVLARFLSLKLPSPYRPEDAYQVPHKRRFPSGGFQIIPQILPQRLRQNLKGYIEVMFMKKGKYPDEKTLNKERMNFFSGSAITSDGLQGNIAIQRTVMDDFRKKFNVLSSDKKSHVSLIFVKVDRGAGSTTMCLQFLYEQHRDYPCAQLIEIKNGLETHIEEMNKKTRLPLVLFVDENIAHLQDFLEFKKKVERRNVNVIFILIEPREVISDAESTRKPQLRSRTKSARDTSLYGPSPYKVIKLIRKLDENEMEVLVKALSVLAKGKKKELLTFKDKARKNDRTGTFANFSLLAFGNNFKGLDKYVKFRLTRAVEIQKNILAFLSLTHVFTDYSLPANSLVDFLNKRDVILEEELKDNYLQELLSPRNPDSDSRRISFHEVAREILKQLSATSSKESSGDDSFWEYIKNISVKMARHVLSKYITTKKIDRITRKLFVTSEYESEKFSQLIRNMKAQNPDTARDTLKELVEVFNEKKRHSSIRAHLRAHLAKYHMIEYNDYVEAKKLIEDAIYEQNKDPLLHHIHGDIIRQYVVDLSKKQNVDMENIVYHARQSSKCFAMVRSANPKMSHGYISDAMVRIHVMQAGKELMPSKNASFVDYLLEKIDEIKKCDDEDISPDSRYLLSVISDAYEYLDERCIDFEMREKWKEIYLSCIGNLENLTRLCDKISLEKECSSFRDCSAWLGELLVQTQILHQTLETENKDLSPQEIEFRLKEMEDYGARAKFGDRFMKFWIRYSRQRLSVPSLQVVKKRVNEWSERMKKKHIVSPQAEFYNFVVHVLMALKHPADSEKMDTAERLTKQQQRKKYNKKDDFSLPYEWLHPKDGYHIESIDCLLHHDDLIKGTNISSKPDRRKPIEGSLFEKKITKWEGVVTTVTSDYQGVITFKGRLPVRFVPLNAQPSMPSQGDTVNFCLSFDGYGLSAWGVVRKAGSQSSSSNLSDIISRNVDDSPSEFDEQENRQEFAVAPSLSSFDIQEPEQNNCQLNEKKSQQPQSGAIKKKRTKWDEYHEQRLCGIVSYSNHELGYGFIENADIEDKLFFHASQLRVPVKNFEGNIVKDILLDFKVEKLGNRTRAADIGVLKDEILCQAMLEKLRKKKQTMTARTTYTNECDKSRYEGSVVMFDKDKGFGFIKPDYDKSGNDIFFGRKSLTTKGLLPKDGDRVQFCVIKTSDGRYEAKDILVQNKSISNSNWDGFIGAGIQEGFVNSTTDDGGTINSTKVTGKKKNLHFKNKDIFNKQKKVVVGTKMHFEVIRRGGRCVAIKINVIDTSEEMLQAEF